MEERHRSGSYSLSLSGSIVLSSLTAARVALSAGRLDPVTVEVDSESTFFRGESSRSSRDDSSVAAVAHE